MKQAVFKHSGNVDAVIMAAAVSDYRPADVQDAKIKKEDVGDELTLRLVKNPDILAAIAANPGLLSGFKLRMVGPVVRERVSA